jgi:hypothetical protein
MNITSTPIIYGFTLKQCDVYLKVLKEINTEKLKQLEEKHLRHKLSVKRAKAKYRKTQKYRDAKKKQNRRYYLRKQGQLV